MSNLFRLDTAVDVIRHALLKHLKDQRVVEFKVVGGERPELVEAVILLTVRESHVRAPATVRVRVTIHREEVEGETEGEADATV